MSLVNIQAQIIKDSKPMKFSAGPGNVLVEMRRQFEASCALIEEHFNISVKDLSLYEYNHRLLSIKDKYKRQSNDNTAGQ